MAEGFVLKAVGDQAILVGLGDSISEDTSRRVMSLNAKVRMTVWEENGILETVPAFNSLLIRYNPLVIGYSSVCHLIRSFMKQEDRIRGPMADWWRFRSVMVGNMVGTWLL